MLSDMQGSPHRLLASLVLFASIAACLAPSSVEAGLLYGGGWSSGLLSATGNNHVSMSPLPSSPDLQLNSVDPLGADGSVAVSAGLFGEVLPSVAYIGITDGSSIEVTPPTTGTGPLAAAMGFSGRVSEIFYTPIVGDTYSPGPLYLYSQYVVHGYLAPGDVLAIGFYAYLYDSGLGGFRRKLESRTWHGEPGEFSISYFDSLQFSDGRTFDSFDLVLSGSITIITAPGNGQSWAILDPGAGTSEDTAIMPWLPPAEVPEPASWLLAVAGIAGLQPMRRKRQLPTRTTMSGTAPESP